MRMSWKEWLESGEAREIGKMFLSLALMCVLSGITALVMAWKAPSMTDICSQCSCQVRGKTVKAEYVPSRPAGKTENIRK